MNTKTPEQEAQEAAEQWHGVSDLVNMQFDECMYECYEQGFAAGIRKERERPVPEDVEAAATKLAEDLSEKIGATNFGFISPAAAAACVHGYLACHSDMMKNLAAKDAEIERLKGDSIAFLEWAELNGWSLDRKERVWNCYTTDHPAWNYKTTQSLYDLFRKETGRESTPTVSNEQILKDQIKALMTEKVALEGEVEKLHALLDRLRDPQNPKHAG